MIGPVDDYRSIYVVACGQQFTTHAQGIDHERNCSACMSQMQRDALDRDNEPDCDGPYLREDWED